jgi:hypothetical protein
MLQEAHVSAHCDFRERTCTYSLDWAAGHCYATELLG